MSKRYREVLDEVETPTTQRVGWPAGEGASEGPGSAGGVATLARPTAPVQVDASDTKPCERSEQLQRVRRTRPGNGPVDADEPLAFAWRGRRYEVMRILGHWREEEGWWRRPDGEPIRVEQSDLWRVEAAPTGGGRGGTPIHGIYELARRGSTWRLDRVWD